MKFATALITMLSVSSVAAGTRGSNKDNAALRILKDGKGKGKGSSSSSDDNPCDVCADGKPDTIRLRYNLPSATSTLHTGNNVPDDLCGFSADYSASNTVSFNGNDVEVEQGTIITINRGEGGAWTAFEFADGPACQMHTSCSWPLVGDDQIGPFQVVGEEGCDAPSGGDECVICDKNDDNNNERPTSLTLKYVSGAGKDSNYQIEEKHASCKASPDAPYPDNVTINVKDKKIGTFQTFTNVKNGDILVLEAPNGRFEANTYFDIEGWTGGGEGQDFSDPSTCHFHTSCSAPLVVGDQIGAFLLMEGNDCTGPPPCVTVDKLEYECGEDISVTWDFAFAPPTMQAPYNGSSEPSIDTTLPTSIFPNGLPDDQIGIWPCGLDLSFPPTDARFAIKTPEVFAYTCAEYGAHPRTCTGPVPSGAITFSDPEPDYVDAGTSHGLPIAPFYLDNAQTQVNECFQAILIRGRGPSVPPYIPVCYSQEFTVKAGTTADCQIRASSPSYPLNAVP